jgi:major membrane immunogen (membrane-anchored lipoprotein)
MKKVLVIALAVIMVVSAFALTACTQPQTVTGECKYENKWSAGEYYGCKVDVTVQNGVITGVKLHTDEETGWHRTTASWTAAEGQLGFEAAEAAYPEYLNKFVGKTVAEVLAVEATATAEGQTVTTEGWNLAGATQSAARIIVAVQNALSK